MLEQFYWGQRIKEWVHTLWRRLGVEEMVLASWLDDSTTLPNPWLARNISEKVENWRRADQVTVWGWHWCTGRTWCWAWAGLGRGFACSKPGIASLFLPTLLECKFLPAAPGQVMDLSLFAKSFCWLRQELNMLRCTFVEQAPSHLFCHIIKTVTLNVVSS